jgi:hypothetical protein
MNGWMGEWMDDNSLFLPPANIDGLLMILKLAALIKNNQTSSKIETGFFNYMCLALKDQRVICIHLYFPKTV